MIGCFSALSRSLITDVVYFYDLTDERKIEAENSASRFGFKAWFAPVAPDFFPSSPYLPPELRRDVRQEDTIFCPTVRDSHPQHAEISKYARYVKLTVGCDLVFYTVDMDSFQVPLPPAVQVKKKEALLELFPSQAALFENEKYFLFEGYSKTDHIESILFYLGDITVTLKGPKVSEEEIIKPEPEEQDTDYLNRLIVRYYNRSTVNHIAIHRGNKTVEFNG